MYIIALNYVGASMGEWSRPLKSFWALPGKGYQALPHPNQSHEPLGESGERLKHRTGNAVLPGDTLLKEAGRVDGSNEQQSCLQMPGTLTQ